MNRMISGLLPSKVTGIIIALLVIAVALSTLAFGACASPTEATAVPASTQVPTPSTEAAAFKVDSFSIYPIQGYPGQQVVITAKVTNTGSVEGEYIGELAINNYLEEQKIVTLPGGAAKTLNFSTFRYEVGTYTVALGELTGKFEVLPGTPQTQGVSVPASSGCSSCGSGCSGCSAPATPSKQTARRGCGCGG